MKFQKDRTKNNSRIHWIPWRKSILIRTAFFSWILIILTLMIYVLATLPYQKTVINDRMQSEAKDIATSIGQVTSTAIITEDYGFAVEHCMKVVKESHSILYVVIVRKDGFSLIHTAKEWKEEQLDGFWKSNPVEKLENNIIYSDLVGKEVFHYTHPFTYSGIDWGWIHIGLSLDKFNEDIKNIYIRTLLLAFICILIGLLSSFYFARNLIRPIKILDQVTQKVAEGNLSARVSLESGDELESLALSFNKMTETLQNSQSELINSREFINNIIKSLNDTLIVINPNGLINSANKATINLLQYSEKELIDKPLENFLISNSINNINGNQSILHYLLNKFESNRLISNEEMFYKSKSGKLIPILFSASSIFSEDDKLIAIACVGLDMTERKKSEEALKHSEERYRAIVEDQTELLCRFSYSGNINFVNVAFCRFFGKSKTNLLNSDFFSLLNLDFEFSLKSLIDKINFDEPVITFENNINFMNFKKWLQWTVRGIFDENKNFVEFQSTGMDITERKLADEEIRELNTSLEIRVAERTSQLEATLKEKEVMLQEIHHRVKNNLQVISSLLNLQLSSIKDPGVLDIFKDSQNRVKSMALIHEELYQSKDLSGIDFDDYLYNLTKSLLRSYGIIDNIKLVIDSNKNSLGIDTAVPCGLIINELVSNSLKYAFTNISEPEIGIMLNKISDKIYKLIIYDNGIGIPENFNIQNSQSLGLRLVNILTKQLKGSLELNSNKGTKFTIIFEDIKKD